LKEKHELDLGKLQQLFDAKSNDFGKTSQELRDLNNRSSFENLSLMTKIEELEVIIIEQADNLK